MKCFNWINIIVFFVGMFGTQVALSGAQAATLGNTDTGFDASTLTNALRALNVDTAQQTSELTIQSPAVVENGASVAVHIKSNLPDTQAICLLVKDNPFPIVGCFRFFPEALASVGLRIRVNQPTTLIALAQADGKLYQASRAIKVAVSGCAPTMAPKTTVKTGGTRINVIQQTNHAAVHIKIQHPTERPANAKVFRQADFVRQVRVVSEKKPLVDAFLGPSMTDAPYLLVYRRGITSPTNVSVFWRDNQGRQRTDQIESATARQQKFSEQ